jgi:hypothetical protein
MQTIIFGPQGEPIFEGRYSPDQPRDPDGKFAATEGKTKFSDIASLSYVLPAQRPDDIKFAALAAANPEAPSLNSYFDKEQKQVSVSDLTLTQWGVFTDKVASYQGQSNKPIDVMRVGDKTYVVDGHHRLAAAILDGNKKINATFWTLKK